MKGTQSYEYPNNPTNLTREDADLKEEEILVNGDVSLLLGAGFELPSGLSINFRSVIGLSNINVKDNSAPQQAETYNLGFQLSVGFPLIAL